MSKTIIVLGGYGVFGGRVADALSANDAFDVVVAGRSEQKAVDFCATRNCRPLAIDTGSETFFQKIKSESPFVVIDATGPFQLYEADPYKTARASIACGAHYLDLSDDGEFTAQIATLDETAKAAGVCALSGASSVPALSSAAAAALSENLDDIHLIESVILPGNKAPRGLSVVKAIIGQAGNPIKIWRGGKFVETKGWSGRKRVGLATSHGGELQNRWASIIGAPDLILFPDYFKARSVLFRAGIDLKLMHGGLGLLSWLVRLKIVKSLSPFASTLKRIADLLEAFGSDTGGMQVNVYGVTPAGHTERRSWTLIIGGGKGPNVPAIPAKILCAKMLSGEIHPGARPVINEFTLTEAEEALSTLPSSTARETSPYHCLFEEALGDAFYLLPAPITDLHRVIDIRRWKGRATVTRGKSLLARAAAMLAGFPPASADMPVIVEMQRTKRGERWTRTFGNKRFRSYLSADPDEHPGRVWERFGLMRFHIDLTVNDGKLSYPVTAGRLLGIPIPKLFLPHSSTFEFVDDNNRANFDVTISLPLGGHVATYRGWLEPADKPAC